MKDNEGTFEEITTVTETDKVFFPKDNSEELEEVTTLSTITP